MKILPGKDRTSPQGAGPRTGRGMGYCGSNDQNGFVNPDPGQRSGFGFGRRGAGRGWRRRFYAADILGWVPPTLEQETADLKAQADLLKKQLDAIQKRIEELN